MNPIPLYINLLFSKYFFACSYKYFSATCNDGIKNQREDDIDCGGPCYPCPTCDDGIQNQDEIDIDCGGPCTACPSCNDGIQNQGEIFIDCGGPCTICKGIMTWPWWFKYSKLGFSHIKI